MNRDLGMRRGEVIDRVGEEAKPGAGEDMLRSTAFSRIGKKTCA